MTAIQSVRLHNPSDFPIGEHVLDLNDGTIWSSRGDLWTRVTSAYTEMSDRELRDALGPIREERIPTLPGSGSANAGASFIGYSQPADAPADNDFVLTTYSAVDIANNINSRFRGVIWEEAGTWLENPPQKEHTPFLKMIIVKL